MARRKRHKKKSPPITKPPRSRSDRLYVVLFLAVLLFSITMLIYQADYTGTSHDESKSFFRYSKDIHTATHKFNSTNNHVLNSIFMHYAYNMFRSYEQYIRVPSTGAGIMFMLAISYVISKTVRSKPLRLVSVLLLCFSTSYYNYLFMARGYSYALMSLAVYIAVVLFLLNHRVKFRCWPVVAIVLSILNFLAVGALLSSVLVMCAINGVFVLFYSAKIFQNISGKVKPMIVMFLSILGTTAVMLHLLFHNIYRNIFSLENNYDLVGLVNKWDGWPSLALHLRHLLIRRVFLPVTVTGKTVFYLILAIICVSMLFYIYRFLQSFRSGKFGDYFHSIQSMTFAIAATLLSVIVLIIYGVFLGRCPGLIRSNVLLTPLAMMGAIGLIDWFIQTVLKGRYRLLLNAAVILLVSTMFIRTKPNFGSPGQMLMARPVLKRLTAYNPDQFWHIKFSKKMGTYDVGFLYYNQFDYKFRIVRGNRKYNVYVCKKSRTPEGAILLDSDYFDPVGYSVVLGGTLEAK